MGDHDELFGYRPAELDSEVVVNVLCVGIRLAILDIPYDGSCCANAGTSVGIDTGYASR